MCLCTHAYSRWALLEVHLPCMHDTCVYAYSRWALLEVRSHKQQDSRQVAPTPALTLTPNADPNPDPHPRP